MSALFGLTILFGATTLVIALALGIFLRRRLAADRSAGQEHADAEAAKPSVEKEVD